MKDLTNTDKQLLLQEIKSFCNITWDNTESDNSLIKMIESSISRIDSIAGVELDYLCQPTQNEIYNEMCNLGKTLLRNRVFYEREKGLDDFEKNYIGEVLSLSLLGKSYRRVNNANQ